MAAPRLSEKLMRQVLEAVRTHGGIIDAAAALDIPEATAQSRWKRAKLWARKKKIAIPELRATSKADQIVEETIVDGEKSQISRRSTEDVRSLEDLIRVCQIDTRVWEVERFICNKWEMGSVTRTMVGDRRVDKPTKTPLFQVKAWLKRKVALVDARREIDDMRAEAKKIIRPRLVVVRRHANVSGNLLEPSIPDLHVGKLAWAKETGWENYDSKIAERVFDDALAALLARTSSFKVDRILLPIGNDLLHSDTKAGTTTGGTPLDMDSRYHKSFALVRRMIVRAVDTCRSIAPITVLMIPGNHDTLSVWHLGDSLECWFRNSKDVEIDNAPSMRKYFQWGKVMLMFTHGNKGKLQDYPLVMAAEQPQMFGATVHREAHTGDKHQLKVQEHHGVRVRISPALCPPDAWHSEHQFVGNARAAEAFVWNRDEGLIGMANYTVQAPARNDAAA